MILAALRQKLATRGPLGFARDAAELALACAVVSVTSGAMLAGAVGGIVVAAPFLAWRLLTEPRPSECTCLNSFDECRCGRGGL